MPVVLYNPNRFGGFHGIFLPEIIGLFLPDLEENLLNCIAGRHCDHGQLFDTTLLCLRQWWPMREFLGAYCYLFLFGRGWSSQSVACACQLHVRLVVTGETV
jgi:hypothetical protein